MKKAKKDLLWYNPVEKDARRCRMENGLVRMGADRESRALLDSFCRTSQTAQLTFRFFLFSMINTSKNFYESF